MPPPPSTQPSVASSQPSAPPGPSPQSSAPAQHSAPAQPSPQSHTCGASPPAANAAYVSEAERNERIIELPVVQEALKAFDGKITKITHKK